MHIPGRGGSIEGPPQTDREPTLDEVQAKLAAGEILTVGEAVVAGLHLVHVPLEQMPDDERSRSILELTKPEQTHPAAEPPARPTPGRIVHYNAASGPMPAIVTHTPESVSDDFAADRPVDGTVHLVLVSAMLHPHGTNTLLNVPEGDDSGSWRWPGRAS